MEAGFTRGDNLVIWTDRSNAGETIITQLGAAKAGVAVVSFDEATS
jgi:acyl-CoA synthetase (AMP-forming)/AMP-acid ligase II